MLSSKRVKPKSGYIILCANPRSYLYGCGVRVLTNTQETKFNTFENKVLRKSIGDSGCRNSEIENTEMFGDKGSVESGLKSLEWLTEGRSCELGM